MQTANLSNRARSIGFGPFGTLISLHPGSRVGNMMTPFPFEAMRAHWTQNEQPARFDSDENGNEKWIYLGQDIDESDWWPVCWIGKEIVP